VEAEAGQSGPTPKWDVSIPEPISDGALAGQIEELGSVVAPVIATHTVQRVVTEDPPIPGQPPVTGAANLTLQVIAVPDVSDPPPQLSPLPSGDPVVRARIEELSRTCRGTELVFVSATVYDNHRTFLRIYPHGQVGDEVTAWSNVDFKMFSGWPVYRVNKSDGTSQDYGLLLGIGDVQTATQQRVAIQAGREYEAPPIPALPDLSASGPAYHIVDGNVGSPAMETLEQVHDLFRKEGARMTAAHNARKQAEDERKAQLLVNPPKPADVTIRYWKGEPNANGTEVAE